MKLDTDVQHLRQMLLLTSMSKFDVKNAILKIFQWQYCMVAFCQSVLLERMMMMMRMMRMMMMMMMMNISAVTVILDIFTIFGNPAEVLLRDR